jgi:transcriptional regulator with XRE-family HTH domain
MDDVRVGRFVRFARRRRRWRQADLAGQSGLSQSTISLIERGHLDRLPLRTLRRVFTALDAAAVDVLWRGGAVDRLLDERHAADVETFCRWLAALGWAFEVEVSYAVYGERGSIDILAWRPPSRSLVVVEIKTELAAIEATMRKLDEKLRLAPAIANDRFKWTAATVSVVLVLPDVSTARRRIATHELTIGSKLPLRTAAVHRWLRAPIGSIGGVVFLSGSHARGTGQAAGANERAGRHDSESPTARSGR